MIRFPTHQIPVTGEWAQQLQDQEQVPGEPTLVSWQHPPLAQQAGQPGNDPWLDAREAQRQQIHQNYVQARADRFEQRHARAQARGLLGAGGRAQQVEAMVDYLYDQAYAGRESPDVDPAEWAQFIERKAIDLVAHGLTPQAIQQVWDAQSWKDNLTHMLRGAVGSVPFGFGGFVADEVAPFAPDSLSKPASGMGTGAVVGSMMGLADRVCDGAMPGKNHYWKTTPTELMDPLVAAQMSGGELSTVQQVRNAAISFSAGYTLRNLLMVAITAAAMTQGVSESAIGEIKKGVEALGSPMIAGPTQGLVSEVLREKQTASSGLGEFLGRPDAASILQTYHENPVDFKSLTGAGNSLIAGLNRAGAMLQDMFANLDKNITPPRFYHNADGSPGGPGWVPPGVSKVLNIGTVAEILLTTALGTTGPLASIVAKPLMEKFGEVGARIYQEAFQTVIKSLLYAGIGPAIAPDLLEAKLEKALPLLEEELKKLVAQNKRQATLSAELERPANYFVG